jgi:diguanylate cyclase (GGDEF)-like protein
MVDRGGVPYFVIDTAKSPDLRTKHDMEPSDYMEKFELEADDDGDRPRQLAAGETYITPEFEQDEYGTFLTAHVPSMTARAAIAALSVWISTRSTTHDAKLVSRSIAIASLAFALLLALVIGYFMARYRRAMHRRMQELHDISIHDSLTGLFNRRGVMEVVKKALEAHVGKSAVLLIDINNLTTINDTSGHVAARTSEAIRENLREGDQCGRLGDEFVVYAPGCGAEGAVKMAGNILTALSEEGMLLAGAPFSVSIGIAVCEATERTSPACTGKPRGALRQARSDGDRIGVAPPSEACQPLEPEDAIA